tara:strand:- start:162 stop:866 length:705 start_codon:yes stop_codon:yes gene_type:complete
MGNKIIISKIFFFLFFLIYPSFLNSHINHYSKIKSIEMDVLRNGKKIGYNKYVFINKNDFLIIENETNFKAKIIGLNLLSVNASSTETYDNGKLVKYKSKSIQNKKKKYTDLFFDESKKIYSIKGSSFSGKAPSNAVIGNWWNHNILQSEVIISPVSGSLKFQEVIFLSKETLKIDDSIYNTSLFKIILRRKIGDEKNEEFNVWLDDKSKIILKVSYSKFGDWEYIVKRVEKLY